MKSTEEIVKNFLGRALMKAAASAVLLSLMLMNCTPLYGWGAGGHMIVAFIAFQRLNPRAKAQVKTLLALPIKPSNVTSKSKDFVNASHWADDVKKLPGFEFSGDLHFIDFPFATDGTKLPTDLPKPDNIVVALDKYVGILKTSTSKTARAQALRFIIHFVGDIHQPLHCATRVDAHHPEGDRGGNLVSVIVPKGKGGTESVALHSYWDDGLRAFPKSGPNFTPPPLSSIPAAAAKVKQDNPDTDPALNLNQPFDFKGWANESEALAKDPVYKDVQNGTHVSSEYSTQGIEVARRRVAFAGYRLAALLNAIWPEH